jgi:hypothetical protein
MIIINSLNKTHLNDILINTFISHISTINENKQDEFLKIANFNQLLLLSKNPILLNCSMNNVLIPLRRRIVTVI